MMKRKILSLLLTSLMLASLSFPVMAVTPLDDFVDSPSVEPEASSDDDIEVVTDNIVTGGYIRQKGLPEERALEQIDYPVIKITTLAMSKPANAKIDAANPGATHAQKAGMMTESGLTYGQNAAVNEAGDRYASTDTTSDFLDGYETALFDRLVIAAEGNMDNYKVLQIAGISANDLAHSSRDNHVRITFSAPGVKVGSRVMVGRIQNHAMEFLSASAGNGTISFDVNPGALGIFVLMTYVE